MVYDLIFGQKKSSFSIFFSKNLQKVSESPNLTVVLVEVILVVMDKKRLVVDERMSPGKKLVSVPTLKVHNDKGGGATFQLGGLT